MKTRGLIGRNLVAEPSGRKTRCGECQKSIQVGDPSLVARDPRGKVRKRVCSERARMSSTRGTWGNRSAGKG
jgi:hypothetical protein